MLLQLCSWPEVEAYLTRSRAILVPIGSTEQHGPNGLLGTDAICPEIIARGVGEKLETMVGPTLGLGMAQHHLAFPGTVALRPSTLQSVVYDVVKSLVRHGFDRVYFLNGHGGNIASITAAFSEVYADSSFTLAPAAATGQSGVEPPAVRCRLRNWWSGTGVQKVSKRLFGASDGAHATASEVALSYYAHPEAAKEVEMQPRVAPYGPIYDALDYRRRFPDGRIGSDPSLATAAKGEELYTAAVDDVCADYQSFIAE